jgi:hypothetical protein
MVTYALWGERLQRLKPLLGAVRSVLKDASLVLRDHYSTRKALIGSVRVARLAGM